MNISILLSHFKTGKMTAYAVAQLLKYSGGHNIQILICDNNSGDGSIEYLKPFERDIKVVDYPKTLLQSHGIGYDYLIPYVENDVFITIESDSYPTEKGWIDYYRKAIGNGYDCGGSVMKLSGGKFMHPCGAFYKKHLWQSAKKYFDELGYDYFPNMSMKEGFACHLMVQKEKTMELLQSHEDYIELSDGYKGLSIEQMLSKKEHYAPVGEGVFHNGMALKEESVHTYGLRDIGTEPSAVRSDKRKTIYNRIGFEPGQALCYFAVASGYALGQAKTEIKWLPGKENQQQEYTKIENGFVHLWGISAYHNYTPEKEKDIALLKQSVPEQLYDTLPPHQKIK